MKASKAWWVVYPTDTLIDRVRVRSVILVNVALDTNTWSQLSIPGLNDLTVVQIVGAFGCLSIFNIYNDCTHSDTIRKLHNYLRENHSKVCSRESDLMIWGGDYNQHHPL